MEPVVIALASNECYFPGLYCAVASALDRMAAERAVDVRVLDGGIFQTSKDILSRLAGRFGNSVRLEFMSMDTSIFRGATLGPGKSHMAYCRILLPRVLDVPRLIYLDCDVLVFRDLSELFDVELSCGKVIAAVPDSETLTLGDDSHTLAGAMNLPADGLYFNSGVMLMNLKELMKDNFTEKSLEFFKNCRGAYRFWDQSAFNFLLHGRIQELPDCWNRAAWRFDQQEDNSLDCVLHYTGSAPWLGGTPGPAQALFDRFAAEVGLPVNRQMAFFKKSRRQQFLRNVLAPFRALAFPVVSLLYRVAGEKDRSGAYHKAARYWFHYIFNTRHRRRLYQKRIQQIQKTDFKFISIESAA